MITQEVTSEMLEEWKKIHEQYKGLLRPNRKSGAEVLDYLQSNYLLTEITDPQVQEVVSGNVLLNEYWAEKLPASQQPIPKTFYLEDVGNGHKFYLSENKDSPDLWGDEITRIFVGVDLASGYFTVEGSSMLWDELYAFQGIDERDLKHCVRVAQYIAALKRFGKLDSVIAHKD